MNSSYGDVGAAWILVVLGVGAVHFAGPQLALDGRSAIAIAAVLIFTAVAVVSQRSIDRSLAHDEVDAKGRVGSIVGVAVVAGGVVASLLSARLLPVYVGAVWGVWMLGTASRYQARRKCG